MLETGSSGYGSASLKNLMRAYERELILMALNASGWHQRRAAASLGILPTTLHEKMKRLGLRDRQLPGASNGETDALSATIS
jgi:DNA-binding NtrC family response regulator